MLTTERLILRDMIPEDEEALSAYHSDAAYLAHYIENPDAGSIVRLAINWAQEEPRANFQFAVVLQSSGKVIGCTGLRQKDYSTGEAGVGVEIDPNYWSRGFAKEALHALLGFGKSTLAIATFRAETTAANARAQSLVEQLGFYRVEALGELVCFELQIGG